MEGKSIMEQKQKYLREEILEKSYDIDEFTDFMSNYKENGTDIQNWEFIELKKAVKSFKNQVNENKIEKGVEKIRESYKFSEEQKNIKNSDEFIDIQLININNNINNDNCVNNILNDYLKNKENEKNKINNLRKDDSNINIEEKNKIFNNEIINKQIKFNNSSILDKDISKKEFENLNIHTIKDNLNDNKNNNKVMVLVTNKENSINNNNLKEGNNQINNNLINRNNNIDNKQKELGDFEILENLNINNKVIEKIKCMKQSENSLTKKDNLYVKLEG
jgi:hypothetical protein